LQGNGSGQVSFLVDWHATYRARADKQLSKVSALTSVLLVGSDVKQ